MAVLLFRLNNVPEEEAQEVRRLLDTHCFDTYETRAGFWGLGIAAIWLRDESLETAAREVIDHYQHRLGERMRREHENLVARGQAPSLWRRLLHRPLRVLFLTVLAAAVLALSLLPFMWLFD